MKCWASRNPIFSWELSRQDSTPVQIRHCAVVFVVVVVLPCSLMSRHQEVLLVMLQAFPHASNCCIPSRDPFVQAHTSCCGIVKSWWSPETEPGTPAGKKYLSTPCAAHSPFLTQGLMPGTKLLFYLFCGGVGLGFFGLNPCFRQKKNLITPTSCCDVSNCIQGSLLPNRCCQGSAELPSVLVTACSDSGADKGSLYPHCCSRVSSSFFPERTLGASWHQSPAKLFPRSEAEALQECPGRFSCST